MTNINCSSNCIYQKDGKCTLEYITNNIAKSNSDCAYFLNKN
ncbi:MAG: hydroxymyristoyl-ACP dehydratase [Clostridia bacterium]|nr:hydroxymyristoyl-ACP dehydratase [Clostridia bacterium]